MENSFVGGGSFRVIGRYVAPFSPPGPDVVEAAAYANRSIDGYLPAESWANMSPSVQELTREALQKLTREALGVAGVKIGL